LRSLTSAEREALKESPAEWTEDPQGYFLHWPCTLEDLRRALGTSADAINEEVAIKYSAFSLQSDDISPTATSRPMPRQRYQELEILRVLRELGFNPLALPTHTPGYSGVKAAVRSKLTDPMWRDTVFNSAWKRMRKSKDLKEA
jgi:hypothetical protein